MKFWKITTIILTLVLNWNIVDGIICFISSKSVDIAKKLPLNCHLERLNSDQQMASHFNLFWPFGFEFFKTTFVAGKSTHKHTAAHPVPVTDFLLCKLNVNVESV